MARVKKLNLNKLLKKYNFKGSKQLQDIAYKAALKKAKKTWFPGLQWQAFIVAYRPAVKFSTVILGPSASAAIIRLSKSNPVPAACEDSPAPPHTFPPPPSTKFLTPQYLSEN